MMLLRLCTVGDFSPVMSKTLHSFFLSCLTECSHVMEDSNHQRHSGRCPCRCRRRRCGHHQPDNPLKMTGWSASSKKEANSSYLKMFLAFITLNGQAGTSVVQTKKIRQLEAMMANDGYLCPNYKKQLGATRS